MMSKPSARPLLSQRRNRKFASGKMSALPAFPASRAPGRCARFSHAPAATGPTTPVAAPHSPSSLHFRSHHRTRRAACCRSTFILNIVTSRGGSRSGAAGLWGHWPVVLTSSAASGRGHGAQGDPATSLCSWVSHETPTLGGGDFGGMR